MATDATQKTPLLGNTKPPVSRRKIRRRRSSFDASTYNIAGQMPGIMKHGETDEQQANQGLSLARILGLTVCMTGVQFTWAVELSYGTPYLLSLDMSKELTALVWLAGPLSGLIVHPIIGAFSDKCTSRFGKRRPFIVVSGILTCLSMIGVAYAKEIGHALAGWMSESTREASSLEHSYTIAVAVTAFYILDFTLNSVQAICRALILDIPPLWQQEYVNAWSARMSNTSMVLGYFIGFVDLIQYLPWLGNSQIKVFCTVSIVVFCISIAITCITTQEKRLEQPEDSEPWYHVFVYIWRALRYLPRPIQTLCNTQFFAWMGWFPFLFYSSQWVSDIYFSAHPKDQGDKVDWTDGTRAGSFALLCYAIVSVITGVVLPAASAKYQQIRCLSISSIYTISHLIVSAALFSAWFVRSVFGATIVVALMGIPWAIVLWIPFSLVGEYVGYEEEKRQRQALPEPLPPSSSSEGQTPYPAPSTAYTVPVETTETDTSVANSDEFDAGMILGVHNMYIVFPQFVVAIIASLIFAATETVPDEDKDGQPSNVPAVFVFGGLMALVAAALSRRIVQVK